MGFHSLFIHFLLVLNRNYEFFIVKALTVVFHFFQLKFKKKITRSMELIADSNQNQINNDLIPVFAFTRQHLAMRKHHCNYALSKN